MEPCVRTNVFEATYKYQVCLAIYLVREKRLVKLDLTGHPYARTEPGNVNKNLTLFLCLLIKN
jgi:hypothetical protein